MIYCNSIDFKGHRLSYFKTNYGALFLARGLIALYRGVSYCTSPLRAYVNPNLLVRIPGGSRAPLCVGLEGAKDIFHGKLDPMLENIMISKRIIQGTLPNESDIKVQEISDTDQNGSLVTNDTEYISVHTDYLSELRKTKKLLQDTQKENERLQKELLDAQKQLNRYLRLYR